MIRHGSGAALLAAWVGVMACRGGPPSREVLLTARAGEVTALERARAEQPEPAPGVLRLALVFGADADLDLFVTGPLQETVYFANSPSAIGGVLEADVRCDAAAPRIETVVFLDPIPGRYRIGVDFPKRCDGGDAPASFAVSAQRGAGPLLGATTGLIRPGEFLTIVLETDVR